MAKLISLVQRILNVIKKKREQSFPKLAKDFSNQLKLEETLIAQKFITGL